MLPAMLSETVILNCLWMQVQCRKKFSLSCFYIVRTSIEFKLYDISDREEQSEIDVSSGFYVLFGSGKSHDHLILLKTGWPVLYG